MDIKWKNYSYSPITKVIAFIIAIACFTGAITLVLNLDNLNLLAFDFEDSYYQSRGYMEESSAIIQNLTTLIGYKSEEHILSGGTITEEEVKKEEDILYSEFKHTSKRYNPNLSDAENYAIFQEVYADRIAQIKEKLIQKDLQKYNFALQRLKEYEGIVYYISDGDNTFTNRPGISKDYVKRFPSYIIFDKFEKSVFPREIAASKYYNWLRPREVNNTLFLGFSDKFLNPRIKEWQKTKELVTNNILKIACFVLGLLVSFIYLIVVVGRKAEDDKVHLNFIDRLYNDVNLVMCSLLIGLWFAVIDLAVFQFDFFEAVIPITASIAIPGLLLVLSLVKHMKKGTLIKHMLIYKVLHRFFRFIKEIYDSGSVGVKTILIVIGYPLLVALTFFMFPVTIGVGVWLALKKVKEFNAIKEGVEKVKNGDLSHKIQLSGSGEFAGLAADINSITDGLNQAVANELKSERLKTELITNVSHDIRTPLTSIITYVDLLKNEKDQAKAEEYIKVIDQKSQRLKILTDDLFEASKASSGNIPVNYEKIDIVSLITQGLGELDDKIKEQELEFKINYPEDKVYIEADGKLLWRAIENLLSNIFKYALKGSRVYIDIEESGTEASIVMKNISARELNISPDELMERFKRGDESRSSEGSGLGLSIAKSLVEIQKGSFDIAIDGDLFKVIIKMPKQKDL